MANPYSAMTLRLAQYLETELQGLGYADLQVRRGIWNPGALETFSRYLVFIAPPGTNPWDERRITTKEVAYTLRAELFLLVKNYNEEQSVFGDAAPDLGVFQMIKDVKELLRDTDLDGLIDRTFNETASGSAFESNASGGFDAGTHGWVHRAKLVYTAQTKPFCHPS